jgi:hypothetical protein
LQQGVAQQLSLQQFAVAQQVPPQRLWPAGQALHCPFTQNCPEVQQAVPLVPVQQVVPEAQQVVPSLQHCPVAQQVVPQRLSPDAQALHVPPTQNPLQH